MPTPSHPTVDPRITLLIGIDDTDNLETRGTGYRARCLGQALVDEGLADLHGITRHQLLVDPRIPYTSHNSSACLQVGAKASTDDIHAFCRRFMLDVAADGSDVGLCLASVDAAAAIIDYALSAKVEVLNQEIARATAAAHDIRLEGLTGTHGGIIGSLAGVGLYVYGDDGRYIWWKNVRELRDSTTTFGAFRDATAIEDIIELDGTSVADRADATVALGPWARPVRVGGRAVLPVETCTDGSADFRVPDKQRIKHFRP